MTEPRFRMGQKVYYGRLDYPCGNGVSDMDTPLKGKVISLDCDCSTWLWKYMIEYVDQDGETQFHYSRALNWYDDEDGNA